jgi:hypothetical protein
MGINTRLEKADALTTEPLVITWSSNKPTAAATQTIANGTVPTVAELGQSVANFAAIIDQIKADLVELRSIINAGE